MIRHIVLFKLKKGVKETEKKQLVDSLKALKGRIPLVKEIEVGLDVGGKHNSYDIALNTVFDSLDAVEEYAVHPDHQKVLAIVKDLCESTVKADFEF